MIVPFIALLLFGERVPRPILWALLPVCFGVVLVSGALEEGAYGADPSRGAVFGIACGVSYATFILIQRHSLMDLSDPAGMLFDTSLVRLGHGALDRAGAGRGRPRTELAERRLAVAARADLAGDRLAADHRLAAQVAGGDDLDDPHDPTDRLGRFGRRVAVAGAKRVAAGRVCVRSCSDWSRSPSGTGRSRRRDVGSACRSRRRIRARSRRPRSPGSTSRSGRTPARRSTSLCRRG